MNDFDPAELERIRRYGRADWRRLVPPGWERGLTPEQIKAQRTEIAKWERAFETPLARRLRKQQEAREAEEQARPEAGQQEEIEREALAMKAELASMRLELVLAEFRWKAECAERKRQADLAWERFMAAFKRGDFRRKANFNPDQPRDELGKWTDADGARSSPSDDGNAAAGLNDADILSDATPDNLFKPGAQLAQDDTARRSPVDLLEEEARGGHTISAHVNRSPEALIAQAREAFEQNPRARDSRSGSFSSIEAATKLVNSTLAQNADVVDRVASGVEMRGRAFAQFNSITGIEAVMPTARAQPFFQQTHGVGVIIDHDPLSPRGFTVWTAFPTNRDR